MHRAAVEWHAAWTKRLAGLLVLGAGLWLLGGPVVPLLGWVGVLTTLVALPLAAAFAWAVFSGRSIAGYFRKSF